MLNKVVYFYYRWLKPLPEFDGDNITVGDMRHFLLYPYYIRSIDEAMFKTRSQFYGLYIALSVGMIATDQPFLEFLAYSLYIAYAISIFISAYSCMRLSLYQKWHALFAPAFDVDLKMYKNNKTLNQSFAAWYAVIDEDFRKKVYPSGPNKRAKDEKVNEK